MNRKKVMLIQRDQIIKSEDFEQIDMGMYQCETEVVLWGNRTNILISCWEEYAAYGYDEQAITRCIDTANTYLEWIAEHKEYIQKIILENHMLQMQYGFAITGKTLRKIKIQIDIQNGIPKEAFAWIYIDTEAFFFEHCHCIEVAIFVNEEGVYKGEVIENIHQLLLEISNVSKEKDVEVSEWAKKNGIFYGFDDEGNMLAVAQQQFCVSIDHKLIEETADNNTRIQRSALYFIRAEWKTEEYIGTRDGIPMPFGFVTNKLICNNNIFMIMSSSGHEIVSGTFFVIQEALTMIEMLYCSRGVTEEEINQCYNVFLVEDHQKYVDRYCK